MDTKIIAHYCEINEMDISEYAEDSDDEDNLCDCGFYHAEDDCPVDTDSEEEF